MVSRKEQKTSDTELLKTCAMDMLEEVLSHNEKKRKTVTELVKQVPLSENSTTRGIEVLTETCFSSLLSNLKKANLWWNWQQTAFWFYKFFWREVFLRGIALFDPITWPIYRTVGIVTDRGPAMIGSQKGLVSRVATVNLALLSFHCIIHKSILC